MKKIFKFLKIALSDYKNVAMLAPTSKYVIRKIIKEFNPGTKIVIEYGPGNGVITKEILKVLPPDGRLIVVEINSEFVEYLKMINDPRLEIIEGDVLEASLSFPKADAIISGIPFSFFPLEKREEIVRRTALALDEEGVFIAYQYSKSFLKVLRNFFGDTKWTIEVRNLPTVMFIMVARLPFRG